MAFTVFRYMFSKKSIRWGNLRRLTPVSNLFGFDRGTPIDRYYINEFLEASHADIQGRVLEVGGNEYTHKYGDRRVEMSDVLHATAENPQATIVGDLATGKGIPKNVFDCMIVTQTFPCIYEMRGAIASCYESLKTGGIVLVTLPGISQISRYDMDRWGDYWRFTTLSAARLFEEAFGTGNVTVKAYGNVLAASSFLYGLASEELTKEELDYHDPNYQLLITVRAVKSES